MVVLDYHLTKGESNPSKSLNIIRGLAESKHFNVVALYTDSENLKRVWLQVAGTLHGGWKTPDDLLDGALLKQWNELTDDDNMPEVDHELLTSYLVDGAKKFMKGKGPSAAIRNEFVEAGVSREHCNQLIEARIAEEFTNKLLKQISFDGDQCNIITGECEDPYWIQSGNLFVAIMKKIQPAEGDENSNDPERIWQRLTDCIKAWRPNMLQILLSEIQNTLEVDGVTIDPNYTGSPALQAGILYTLFEKIPQAEAESIQGSFRPAIEDLTWKLVESIRRKISTNKELVEIAERLVCYEISKDEWNNISPDEKKKKKDVLDFIKNNLFKTTTTINDQELFFELNAFLSSDNFRGSHLTTGTIFKLDGKDDWWMCSTPACDMEPRTPNEWKENSRSTWDLENHPTKKMVALRLGLADNAMKDLGKANRGQKIFIRDNGTNYQFDVLNDKNHPNWEILILDNSSTIELLEHDLSKPQFKAYVLETDITEGIGAQSGSTVCKLKNKTFQIIAQLRPEYANRILQFTGHHLSRIGVDFVSQTH